MGFVVGSAAENRAPQKRGIQQSILRETLGGGDLHLKEINETVDIQEKAQIF